MAEIDKALPNVEQTVNIPSPDDIEVAEQEEESTQEDGSPDVQENEDGSVDINFEPGSVNPGQDEGHFANLAELLPDDVLDPLGHEMSENYMDYKSSRKDWEQSYVKGLDLLGFKYEESTQPFKGASGADRKSVV